MKNLSFLLYHTLGNETLSLFAKIHKDQASQLELLRHTKRAMDKSLASKDSADNGSASLASLVRNAPIIFY